jgi:hypothetical protein
VTRQVIFSPVPTDASWRYDERFQIAPVPSHAPRPITVIGDHPLLLEMRVKRSENFRLTNLSVRRELVTFTLLLNLLTRFGVERPLSTPGGRGATTGRRRPRAENPPPTTHHYLRAGWRRRRTAVDPTQSAAPARQEQTRARTGSTPPGSHEPVSHRRATLPRRRNVNVRRLQR